MQQFLYEAVAPDGQTIMGKVDATDAAEVQRTLMMQGYHPQSIAPTQNLPTVQTAVTPLNPIPQVQQAGVPARTTSGVTLAGNAARMQARSAPRSSSATATEALAGVKNADLMSLFQQFAALVKSGMTVYAALDNLAPRTKNQNLALTLRDMADAARQGKTLSEVMARYPRIYEPHIVSMVRAGELGGFLDIVLSEIALNFEQNVALYRGAWVPVSLATQAFFLIPIVQPFFSSLFSSLDFAANIQLYFKLLLFRNLPVAIVIYLGIVLAARSLQLPRYRAWRDAVSLRLPPFGDLQRQASLSAFVRMLRKLYHAGVSPVLAWEAAMNTASNSVIREKLAQSYGIMQRGGSLGDAFAATGLFDNGIEQAIITGQLSGQVVESLDRAADFYQNQVEQTAEKSRKAMQRLGRLAMMILGGAALLIMVKTYFGGIFHLFGSFDE
jgi:type IV pilus assembly protein PilC